MTSESAALSMEGVRFAYPRRAGRETFEFSVAAFELAAGGEALVTGPSGCGKSTMLSLVAGLLDVDAGSIRVAGKDITSLRGAARDRFRGQTIGMVFQTFNLLPGFTALDNVNAALMFSERPPGQHDDHARGLLDGLGVTDADAHVDELSVGQQQRVAVARAVACEPSLVLADEPTASLDPESGEAAIAVIRDACKRVGAALLCVSHDPSLPERFERRHAFSEIASVGGGGV